MPITSLGYEEPIKRSNEARELDFELFEQSIQLAEQGRHLESLVKVLEHLFPGRTIPNLATGPFTFTQGSSFVSVRIEGDDIVASVPLVRLPSGGSAIAAMRFILSRISATGQLYQPVLRGDDVALEWRDHLSRFHPMKAIEVLRKMPREADDSDDYLCGQFQASALERAPIQDLDGAEAARAESIWRQHWDDVDELLKECRRKRSMWFLNELTAFALNRVGFALPLTGFVGAKLDEAGSVFNDCNEDAMKREAALGKCVKEMKAVTAEALLKSLGHAEYAISPVRAGTPGLIYEYFGDGRYMDTLGELRKGQNAMDAVLGIVGTYNFLLARYAWPQPIELEMKRGLALAAGKPWREAASALYDHAKALGEDYGEEEEEEDDEDEDDEGEDDEGEDGEDGDDEDGDEEEDGE